MEKRRPVDELTQRRQRKFVEHADSGKFRNRQIFLAPPNWSAACDLRTASYSARCCATNSALPSSLSRLVVTGTARLASRTCTTGSLYCGAILTAVCARLVVA